MWTGDVFAKAAGTYVYKKTEVDVDIVRLFKFRVIVARYGEADRNRWWSTNGQLGPLGTAALRKVFLNTYRFAAAYSVFESAQARCEEQYDPPNSVNLWRLTEIIEQAVEEESEYWCDTSDEWEPFFNRVETIDGPDLIAIFKSFDLIREGDMEAFAKLQLTAEGRAIEIPGRFNSQDSDVAMLAMGFAFGGPLHLVAPHSLLPD